MFEIFHNLTNREIASLFYIGLFLIFVLIHKEIRKSLFQIIVWMWWVKYPLLLATIFISINIFLVLFFLSEYNIFKEIIIWCFVVPFPLLLGANKIKDDIDYFKKIIQSSLKLTVIIAFIVNTYTFWIIWEIILLFFLLLFTIVWTFSEYKEEYNQVKSFSDYVLLLVWIAILLVAVYGFISEPDKILAIENIYIFFTPILLTILFLPFIYLFALVMEYEVFLIRVKVFPQEYFPKYKIFLYIFKMCHLNLYKLNAFFNFYMQRRMWWTEEYFLSVIDDFKKKK